MVVWTETHASGDELEAMRGWLAGKGWGTEATAGYVTATGRIRGGVIIAWREEVMKRERKACVEGCLVAFTSSDFTFFFSRF